MYSLRRQKTLIVWILIFLAIAILMAICIATCLIPDLNEMHRAEATAAADMATAVFGAQQLRLQLTAEAVLNGVGQ